MYDRGKCVKLSPPIIDDYLGRRNVTSIDKLMTKEEGEIASEDEEEHYIEILKYNEIMELHSDAQSLKIMLIDAACYPRLMKEIDVGKDVLDSVFNICAPVDETDLVFDGEM